MRREFRSIPARWLMAILAVILTSTALVASPAGADPTGLASSNITQTSFDLSWTASGLATDGHRVTVNVDGGAQVYTADIPLGTNSDTVTGLTASTAYDVSVVALAAGLPVGNAATLDNVTTAAPPVSAPTMGAVTATANGSSAVIVSWVLAADGGEAPTYVVSISPADAAPQNLAAGSTSTSFSGLDASTAYTVTVTATNSGGSDDNSDSATTAAPPVGAPDLGTVTATANGTSGVNVSWSLNSAGGEAPTYAVSISPADAAPQNLAAGSTSASFTGLDPATTYTVTVVATNSGGNDSGTDSATTATAPPVLGNVNVTSSDEDSITISWSLTDDGGDPPSYAVTVSPNEGSVSVTGTSATISGLSPATEYTITVTATNDGGSVNGQATATTDIGGAGAPPRPTARLAGPNGEFVQVSWAAPTSTGGELTGFVIRLSNGASITVNDGAQRSVIFESDNVDQAESVTATVAARNSAGTGTFSAASNQVTTSDVPGAVPSVDADWGGADALNSIDVTWSPAADDGNGSDGTGTTYASITGYRITVTPALASPIPDAAPGATSLTIGGLEPGVTYTVRVAAVNELGAGPAVAAAPVLVPDVPGVVTDIAVAQQPPFGPSATITWTLPTDDGGSPILGFRVEVDDDSVDAVEVGADATSVTFTGLPVGTFNASIRAITAAGPGPAVTSPNFEVKGFPPFDSEEDFVRQLYADFLLRAPDAAGIRFWTDRVADDGSNVQEIVESFMRSPEYAPRRSVARLYFAYFNRQPDKAGFDFWTRRIAAGTASLETVSQFFASSAEFQRTYGSLSDAEFVVLVYNNVLFRRPDEAGFQYWFRQLQLGLDRGRLMTLFSESPEFVETSRPAVDVTVTYDGLLLRAPETTCNRNADPDCIPGFQFWTGQVERSNAGLTQLIRSFFFSQEYADRVNR